MGLSSGLIPLWAQLHPRLVGMWRGRQRRAEAAESSGMAKPAAGRQGAARPAAAPGQPSAVSVPRRQEQSLEQSLEQRQEQSLEQRQEQRQELAIEASGSAQGPSPTPSSSLTICSRTPSPPRLPRFQKRRAHSLQDALELHRKRRHQHRRRQCKRLIQEKEINFLFSFQRNSGSAFSPVSDWCLRRC